MVQAFLSAAATTLCNDPSACNFRRPWVANVCFRFSALCREKCNLRAETLGGFSVEKNMDEQSASILLRELHKLMMNVKTTENS